jgi:hypothetical protein
MAAFHGRRPFPNPSARLRGRLPGPASAWASLSAARAPR